MHPAEQAELDQREAVKVFVHVARFGPQTTRSLIEADIVSNPDDAIAAMARLVREQRCEWCDVRRNGRVLRAVRVAGWHSSERV